MNTKITFLSIMLLIIMPVALVSAQGTGEGGGSVRIDTIDLTEQGVSYNITARRLKFEFDGAPYAIQLRRVKQEYAWFLVMTLDADKPDDITAYVIDDSFNLSIGDTKEIDVNQDGVKDIFIQLNNITGIGEYGSAKYANFSVKKITPLLEEEDKEEKETEEIEEEEIIEETPEDKKEAPIEEEKEVGEEVIVEEEEKSELEVEEEKVSAVEKEINVKEEPKSLFSRIIQFLKSLFS